ncbi:hypothetical protein Bsp3421_000126 (plasmid) [Burkholderia sp. FERM BP-3421]|uniref:hypothetical protein n=1 Tax=Burkholderia sp. FERM BP-3421 TaxID=1494466 RepID=UPI00236274E3|nr:hypothetical protein [Burkholderia sp. FERM BP-3421]WDD90301.1 hypothetical protein Bsp3421_000126 [Burkholderia sp. FERM BP-3421]
MTRRFDILLPDDQPIEHAPWCWRDDWHARGESSLALLAKFQRLNALSCAVLIDTFVCRDVRRNVPRDHDLRDARRFDVPRMMAILRLSVTDVAAAFVMPSHRLERIAFATLRWCPKCSQEGVHLCAFQYRATEQCPVHRGPLAQHCEQCGAAIPYRLRPDLLRAPFHCLECSHPWFTPARGPDNFRVGQAYRSLLRERAADRLPAIGTEGALLRSRRATRRHPLSVEQEREALHVRLPREPVWTMFGRSDAIKDDPAQDDTEQEGGTDDGDIDAYGCYRAVRRWIMREYCVRHRACIATAAWHLSWSLTGGTTAPFCPIAQAFLRWRCKWEGFGTPSALLQPPLHGPLGLSVWLSLYAPVAQRSWSHAASRWVVMHLLGRACIDSFLTFLSEADQLRMHRRILWLPFPVHDFPRRHVVARGGYRRGEPISFCVSPLREGDIACESTWSLDGDGHRREHLDGLRRNVAPANLAAFLGPTTGALGVPCGAA